MMRVLRLGAVSVVASLAMVAEAGAQVRASEQGGVFQVVNGTTITVEYSRPGVRGRPTIFGAEIPWGEVWTPGANWATTLDVDKDVTVNGHPLKKGKYSVWMEVQPKEWTVILDPKSRAFHFNRPASDSNQTRFAVTPTSISGPDWLTWSFVDLSASGTTLQMAWAGKAVALNIVVPPVAIPFLSADLAAEYTGKYRVTFRGEGPTGEMQIKYADGRLLADWTRPPEAVWAHLVFIKIADDWFYPGAMVNNALFDVVTDLVFEFAVTGGRATGFGIRALNDQMVGEGTLVP